MNPNVDRSRRGPVLVAGLAVVVVAVLFVILMPRLLRPSSSMTPGVDRAVEEPLGEAFVAGLVLGTERAVVEYRIPDTVPARVSSRHARLRAALRALELPGADRLVTCLAGATTLKTVDSVIHEVDMLTFRGHEYAGTAVLVIGLQVAPLRVLAVLCGQASGMADTAQPVVRLTERVKFHQHFLVNAVPRAPLSDAAERTVWALAEFEPGDAAGRRTGESASMELVRLFDVTPSLLPDRAAEAKIPR